MKEKDLKNLAEKVAAIYPGASIGFQRQESYGNMKYKLDEQPQVTDYALKAVERAGLKPVLSFIRGGTDGARSSYKGLLSPNIFTASSSPCNLDLPYTDSGYGVSSGV